MIRNSLEWAETDTSLRYCVHTKITTSGNKDQICKMIDNVGVEVTALSKAEVLARRGSKHFAEEILVKINNDIEMIEEFILIAALIG